MVEPKPFIKFGVWFPIVGTLATLFLTTVGYVLGFFFFGLGQDLLTLQIVGMVLYVLWGAWALLGWGLSKNKLSTVFSLHKIKPAMIFWTIVLSILAQFAIIAVTQFSSVVLEQELEGNATDLITEQTGTALVIVTILSAVVFAPIFEEILFRSLFFDGIFNTSKKLKATNKTATVLAILISSLLFGLAHVTSLDINGAYIYIITALFGAYLAWLRVKTQSLTLSIISHSTFNSVTMILLILTA